MQTKVLRFCVGAVLTMSLAASALAQEAKTTKISGDKTNASSVDLPPLKFEKFTLDNGLRVVLNPDNSIPVVSVAVYYDVGSRNERKGRDGFAHLFEHMMFQGSENIGKSQHFQYVTNAGGTFNGTTATQRTNYFETLPANQLPLALWLESDRMRSLKITKENLENQREVVKEERRQRYDNQPYGQIFDILTTMTYQNFSNSHSTIGSLEDLNAATLDDVKEFFRIYYAPNNAVLTISGAFDTKETKALVTKYFATIPRQEKPPVVDVTETTEVATKTRTFEDKLAPFPAFLIGYKIPARRTPEFNALYLGGQLLYGGDSSRLYQKLVKTDKTVLQLFGSTDERRGPSLVYIGAIPKPNTDPKVIRQVIFDEIKNLSTTAPTADEMERLRNGLIDGEVRGRQSSLYRSQQLA
ncbi:MAG: insulinase family protein, partial [Pyrinomonadaceae bacterium]|nr:insulinase family protein [Pyrinomonadaceae bacterium]